MIRLLFYKPTKEWWWSKLVEAVTGSDYYHVALWIGDVIYNKPRHGQSIGYIYEEVAYFDSKGGWHGGAVKRKAGLERDVFKIRDEIIVDEAKIKEWVEILSKRSVKYNLSLLIAMPIIYPLRWLWKILKWSPFKPAVFGYICSTFVDFCLKMGGVDLLPDRSEYYTTPGDLAKSELLVKE